jgi:hypothetical protein
MEKRTTSESSLYCDLSALDTAQRERYQANTRQLFGSVKQIEELPDGYAFTWSAGAVTILNAAEFINLERLCCPFFDFALEINGKGGSLRLTLTGREGVKQFILIEEIKAGIKTGQCACDIRNPQGSCCLGNVSAVVKRFIPAIHGPV